jgi:hypothetical protein
VSGLGLAGSVVVEPAGARSVFVPRKFQARAVAKVGGDLWGYLAGGREQADYYLGADGTPCEAVAELHGRLWVRLGLARLDRVAFGRLAAGCHPLTGERLIKTSHITNLDPVTGVAVPRGGMHVPGIDCNLSPPKSVSALLLPFVSPEGRAALERADLAAVRVTLQELEARVAACRPTRRRSHCWRTSWAAQVMVPRDNPGLEAKRHPDRRCNPEWPACGEGRGGTLQAAPSAAGDALWRGWAS